MHESNLQRCIRLFTVFLLTVGLFGCSSENQETLNKLGTIAENMEKHGDVIESQFSEECTNKLNKALESKTDDMIDASLQQKIASILIECVGAIENELVLTEKEFPASADNKSCLDGVRQIREYLPTLTSKINEYQSLPNTTKEERIGVTMAFSFASTDVMGQGSAAALNRLMSCRMGLHDIQGK